MATIRDASTTDAAAIAQVRSESWRSTYAGIVPDAFLAALDPAEFSRRVAEAMEAGKRISVAEQQGRVVGFAYGGAIRGAVCDATAELYALYLLQDMQGRGLGRGLLEAVYRDLAGEMPLRMAAWVLEANPARGFYRASGAIEVARKGIEIGGRVLPEIAVLWTKAPFSGLQSMPIGTDGSIPA